MEPLNVTAKELQELKRVTDIDEVTPTDIRKLALTKREGNGYYYSKYDLEHKKTVRNLRFNKYGEWV